MSETIDEVTKEQLIADFQKVVADAEALLKATAKQGGEELAGVRARAEESLRTVKHRIAQEQAAMIAKTKEAAGATDAYVHENPWMAVAIAAGAGLVIGLLSGRR
jgi:ElaB/YqjD/DUF883 family membrane-anchored ribosome-binding protein